jgi:hypothetical protein
MTSASDTPNDLRPGTRISGILRRSKWLIALGVLLITLIVISLATSDNSGPSTTGLRNDKLTQTIENGSMQRMLEQHRSMLEQMRSGLSPQMQQLMDADPMWKLMRTGELTKMTEDQQQQIDRMLVRGTP